MLLLLKVHIGELKLGVLSLYTKLFRYWRGFLYLWLRRLSGVACENIRFSSLFARWGTLGARGFSCRLRPTKRSSPSHARKTSGTHNLGQNKMEQQTPIPPQIKDEGARRAKTCHFPILDLGGRGGLGFPFILSKIAGCRWRGLRAKRPQRRRAKRNGCFRRLCQGRRWAESYLRSVAEL